MQTSDLLASPEPVLKDWTMKRNCSLSPRQFMCFYASLAFVSIAIAVLLLIYGAWLVLPFTGSICWWWGAPLPSMRAMLSITNESGCIRTGW